MLLVASWRIRWAAGAAALAFVLPGCGGDKKSSTRAQACEQRAENAAAAAVVQKAFAAGKLGTRAQVQHSFKGAQIFDRSGQMVPYNELGADERATFDEWMNNNPRVLNATLDAQTAARARVRANPPAQCS